MIRHQDYFDALHPPAFVVAHDPAVSRGDAGGMRRLLLPSRWLDGRKLFLGELPVRRFHPSFARLIGWQTSPASSPRNLAAAGASACRGRANCPLSPAAAASGLRAPAALSAAGTDFSRTAAASTGNAVSRDATEPRGRADSGSPSRSGSRIGRAAVFSCRAAKLGPIANSRGEAAKSAHFCQGRASVRATAQHVKRPIHEGR
jgi:hypothetical protein